MKSLKQYTIIPIEACKQFKLKDLYLLTGLYINAPYERGAEYMITDTTFKQLSDTTGVSIDYIKDSFIPKLKEKGYRVDTVQNGYKVKRNVYYLPNPSENYRFIWAELFSDSSLSPEEKGFMIGLYCLSINNEFRINLPDKVIYEHFDMTKNTYVKYRDLLFKKKVIWSSYDAPMALTWSEYMKAKVILYPHLGHTTWIDRVLSNVPTDDEIKDYFSSIA